MKLFVSNYASQHKFERFGVLRRVRISRGKDRLGRFDTSVIELAPSRRLLERYRSANIDENEYAHKYWEEVDPVWRFAVSRLRDGDCLLCFCPVGSPCHRLLVAERLRKEGHQVVEF
ncbi:MAG: DUF488 family protein [Deltaproteobacteria bacterium]|nr:DUF488 family protein [Deltaproteobacteria bacterium]